MEKRKHYYAGFKAKVAMAAVSGNKTIAELSSEFGVHQSMINKWKRQLTEGAASVFSSDCKANSDTAHEKEITRLHALIGKIEAERDFLAEAWKRV